MSDFDYKTAPLVEALRHYLKDMPDLGYNGQYLIREAAAEIERLKAELIGEKELRIWHVSEINQKDIRILDAHKILSELDDDNTYRLSGRGVADVSIQIEDWLQGGK